MKRLLALLSVLALPYAAHAVAYGSLNNFDVVNDTGGTCYGFEIELDDLHSTDISYTYDYNHYGVPKITEDNTDPLHPKVFVRYEAKKNPDGTFASFTNPQDPLHPLGATDGHAFTNPGVNLGGEHFGVGFNASPSVVKYHWLVEDITAPGTLVLGPAVNVATPTFNYIPAQPAVPAQAQVVIVPPDPEVPEIENIPQFGVPVWVKVIKTVQPSGHKIALNELLPLDEVNDPGGVAPWQGEVEQPETEVEWQVFQKRPPGNLDAQGGEGEIEAADDLPNGDETVTRRYEFYVYNGPTNPEDGEAQCDNPATCTDADGNLIADAVGNFIGAQMAGFNVETPLGLIDHLQDEDVFVPYVDRAVVVGGTEPYAVEVTTGVLPDGLALDPVSGVLSGTPVAIGAFAFTVKATDADNVVVTKDYTLAINGPVSLNGAVAITRSGFRLNRATGRFVQMVTLKNTSADAHVGPVSLILDGLSANASLANATGTTAFFAPLDSPYLDLDVGADGILSPGEVVTAKLEFTNPSRLGITYTTRVLAGAGSR